MTRTRTPDRRHGGGFDLDLAYETLRYLPCRQVAALVQHRTKTFFRGAFPAFATRSVRGSADRAARSTRVRPNRHSMGTVTQGSSDFSAFRRGSIRLLNLDFSFEPGKVWDLSDSDELSPLARETLQYHKFLTDFAAREPSSEVGPVLEATLEDWRKRFPPGASAAWNPFTVATRAQNWMDLYRVPIEIDSRGLERSLLEHALSLEANLERHLGGNHLMKDLCALAELSVFFEGSYPDRWRRTAMRGLEIEVEKQILSDGGHYERSPMYHLLVLDDLLRAALSLRQVDPRWVEDRLAVPLARMTRFARGFLHPDGEVPFFNDSVLGQAPPPAEVDSRAREAGIDSSPSSLETAFPVSGYSRLGEGSLTLLFDHGPLGPDELLGHAHNDALSVELSVGETRFLANRGTFEYTWDERRKQCRSIRSHNTPRVDDAEQSEIWGSFRAARRTHPTSEIHLEPVDGVRAAAARWRVGPSEPEIERTVFALGAGAFLLLDRISGEGEHRCAIPFRFYNGVDIAPGSGFEWNTERDRFDWEAIREERNLWGRFLFSSPATVALNETTIWPAFNVEEPALEILVDYRGALPFAALTLLSEPGTPATMDGSFRDTITIEIGNRRFFLRDSWSPDLRSLSSVRV